MTIKRILFKWSKPIKINLKLDVKGDETLAKTHTHKKMPWHTHTMASTQSDSRFSTTTNHLIIIVIFSLIYFLRLFFSCIYRFYRLPMGFLTCFSSTLSNCRPLGFARMRSTIYRIKLSPTGGYGSERRRPLAPCCPARLGGWVCTGETADRSQSTLSDLFSALLPRALPAPPSVVRWDAAGLAHVTLSPVPYILIYSRTSLQKPLWFYSV